MKRIVGVNLLWLVPGVVGGSEEALVGMLAGVAEREPTDVEVVLFTLASLPAAHPWLTDAFRTVVAPIDGSSKARRVLAENGWLRRAARRCGVELLHHAGGVVAPGSALPSTLTIHDLQPFDLPSNFGAVKRVYLGATVRRGARRALGVAVPSEFVASGVRRRFGLDVDRVSVIPWSVERHADAGRRTDLLPAGVGGRFVLYPAITYPHKNHRLLVRALALLTGDEADLELVLTGGRGSVEEELRRDIETFGVGARIHRLGRVPDSVLRALYASAGAVVFPSLYEGFGLPVLEAMAAGVAVITSDAPGLDDVVPPHSQRIAPDDPQAWADAIRRVFTDAAHREALIAAGRRSASAFTPQRSADGYLRMWRNALETVR